MELTTSRLFFGPLSPKEAAERESLKRRYVGMLNGSIRPEVKQ
jgi:hypothetical protein